MPAFVPLVLATLALSSIFHADVALGVCFEPAPTLGCKYLNSDLVFVGTVLSTRVEPPGVKPDPYAPLAFNGIQGWVYTFSVQKMFRGPQVKEISVVSTNDESRVFLADGMSYLIFADRTPEEGLNLELGYEYSIENCDNPTAAVDATQEIRELQVMKIPTDAEIEGRVTSLGSSNSPPAPELRVVACEVESVIRGGRVGLRCAGRSFEASTDRNGWFHLHVPPGSYAARVRQISNWKIAPFGASLDDPGDFEAREGRCSELQFIATPK